MLAFTYTLMQNVKRVEERHKSLNQKTKKEFFITVKRKIKN